MTKKKQFAALLDQDGWSEQDIRAAFGQPVESMTRERVARTLRILGCGPTMRKKVVNAWLEGARERARSLSAQE